MKEAIEQLRQAAKDVAEYTKETFIFAGMEFEHNGQVEFYVYRREYHRGATLEDAVAKAMAYDAKEQRRIEIEKLKEKLAKLEQGAS